MNKIMLALFFSILCSCLYAQTDDAKLVYIKQNVDMEKLHYVGETIQVTYNVLIFDKASVRSISFLDSPESNVVLKNPNSSWNELSDGSLKNTFYFKINGVNFYIPQLEVIVDNIESQDRDVSDIVRGNAIALGVNHPKYSGVVAQDFIINDYSVKFYDQNNNIAIFDLSANYANLEDFKLQNITNQGFESSKFGIAKSSGIYYAIIPNNISIFEFEYFNTQSQSYNMQYIKNTINKEQISVNQDINPINKVLIFKDMALFIIIVVLLIAFFIRKIPFKIRLVGLIIAIFLLLYLLIWTSSKHIATLKANSVITILPTNNSTIIEKIANDTQVQILNTHKDYYKITTNNGKIGWVAKDDIIK